MFRTLFTESQFPRVASKKRDTSSALDFYKSILKAQNYIYCKLLGKGFNSDIDVPKTIFIQRDKIVLYGFQNISNDSS